MKHLYELPTDDVILNCLANDVIGRNSDVVSFCNIIDSFKYSTTVSLDGSWGSGKTFFVKQAKMLIDAKCNPNSLDDELLKGFTNAIETNPKIYSEVSFEQKHSTVYYDAWENDNDTDPILSIVYSVISSKQARLHVHNERDLGGILASIAECVTGRSISTLFETLKGKNIFEKIRKEKSIQELMRKFFDAAIGKECHRLVVFIDELDRCKPSYAVLLLERIKHFFSDNRLTFIFSINRDQLQHTIRNFYGNEINASKYLDKFFDLNIRIPTAIKTRFLANIGFAKTEYIIDAVCYATIEQLNLELREIAKFVQHLKVTIYDEMHDEAQGRYRSFSMSFCMIYIAPVLVALQLIDQNLYEQFICGDYVTPLLEIVSVQKFADGAEHWLLDNNEKYTFTSDDSKDVKVDFNKRLKDVYEAIFKERYLVINTKRVGKMEFDINTKSELLKVIEPIANFKKTRQL